MPVTALEVVWLPAELAACPPGGRTAIVVDVIRATTTIATALAQGAARVVPTRTVEEARRVARATEGALLCGERNGLPPEGFDVGNSPASFGPDAVGGRTLVFTTSNGTAAVEAALEADTLRLGCFRNAEAVVRVLAGEQAGAADALIVCAGRRGRISMDDAWCAGHLVDRVARRVSGLALGDGAKAAMALAADLGRPTPSGLASTAAGRGLRDIGLAEDLSACAALDDLDVVPTLRGGAFVKGGEEDA